MEICIYLLSEKNPTKVDRNNKEQQCSLFEPNAFTISILQIQMLQISKSIRRLIKVSHDFSFKTASQLKFPPVQMGLNVWDCRTLGKDLAITR
ncbi:CLUMA_CG002049, isoform A [Clunio marinus]|uniref:CLUMA_CG002049, isoform A n=1 Tax=Clunio marinus TaxID=568069 RepID=A0A1J1HJR8_9DIPT|nr:CLUMA_CG002049, isoform A [Clunio marinus]